MRVASGGWPTAYVLLAQSVRWCCQRIRRGLIAYPQAQTERRLSPLGNLRTSDVLTSTNQRRGALELLQSQQSQRVAHQHSNPVIAATTFDLPL